MSAEPKYRWYEDSEGAEMERRAAAYPRLIESLKRSNKWVKMVGWVGSREQADANTQLLAELGERDG